MGLNLQEKQAVVAEVSAQVAQAQTIVLAVDPPIYDRDPFESCDIAEAREALNELKPLLREGVFERAQTEVENLFAIIKEETRKKR